MITILAILTKIKNFIFKYWKQLLLIGLGAFLTLKVQGCAHKLFPPKNPNSSPSNPTAPVLPKGDKEIIKVNPTNGTTTVTTSKGTTTVSGTRGTTIEVKKDGTVKVTEKTIGFCLNPMIGFGGNNTGIKGIIAAEIFYYKKLDLIGGMGADKYLNHTAMFLAIGYTPQNSVFHNTAFWIGPSVDTTGSKGIMAGVTVRI